MAFKQFSDVRETSTTGGTGNQVLAGALDGSYNAFGSVGRYADGDTFFYCMKLGTQREIGLGTYNAGANSIARTQVYKSTNANALVNFGAGTVDIFVTHIASDDLDAAGRALLAAGNGFVGLNLLVNPDFRINQRGYVSAAALAVGLYGHDRWKAGASGGNYSFTQLQSSTQITIASGKSLIQVAENKDVVGGSYTLSWSGTAQARVGVNTATPSGGYAASPITISGQTAGTAMAVEFNTGTLSNVKLEAGSLPTPFVMRSINDELRQALRYCYVWNAAGNQFEPISPGAVYTSTTCFANLRLPVQMRAVPSVTFLNVSSLIIISANINQVPSAVIVDVAGNDSVSLNLTVSGFTLGQACNVRAAVTTARIICDAEL